VTTVGVKGLTAINRVGDKKLFVIASGDILMSRDRNARVFNEIGVAFLSNRYTPCHISIVV